MSVLQIIEWPAKILEQKAEVVSVFDKQFLDFVKNLHETMDAEDAIGLAANQVNVLQRVFVIHIPYIEPKQPTTDPEELKKWWHDKRFTFVNPVIVKKSGRSSGTEGCLSFPSIYEYIERNENITVVAQDEHGREFTVEATGLFSACIQHELDHIDGIVFINRMSRLKFAAIRKKLQKKLTQVL